MGNDLKILKDNFNCKKGSFIHYLHEDSVFHDQAFWKYCNAVLGLTKVNSGQGALEREAARMVFHTYSDILRLFIYHLSPKDSCKIKKFPLSQLSLYIERL